VPLQGSTIPANTDSVSCSPIFEIRETQNPSASINTFGNANLNPAGYSTNSVPKVGVRDTQYSNNTPGPPFHLSNVNSINISTHNAQYLPPQISAQAGLGTATSQDFTPASFTFHDGNEMDLSGDRSVDQPSPATISSNSRGGSTSHSSYSPGQQTEHHLPYRASPKPGFGHIPASGGTAAFPGFSQSATSTSTGGADMFSNTFSNTGLPPDESFNQGFLMGNDWEYGALNAGTGMTPMSDGSWNQMLESVTMGWDGGGVGGPHGPIGDQPGSR
tara:strand:+ start:2919 stop:3740 length:822 start_codon:yes stop_codon:yes gene_type:complete